MGIFQNFVNKYNGKRIDVDNMYGAQCVDLFNKYNKDYFGVYINCQPSGYARSLAENKKNNKILKYYKEVNLSNAMAGSVVVYGKCKIAPKSHVGFLCENLHNGKIKIFHQTSSLGHAGIETITADGIIGVFTPNNLLDEQEDKFFIACKYTGFSIVDALKSIGANSSYAYRCKIAKANDIVNYKGTAMQNLKMLSLLKKGKLIKP